MSERIRSLSAELSSSKQHTQYFRIARHIGDNGFDFAVDTDKVDLLRHYRGFLLIFSTDNGISHDDVLIREMFIRSSKNNPVTELLILARSQIKELSLAPSG